MIYGAGIVTLRWCVRLPAIELSDNNLRQVVYTHTHASVIKPYDLVSVTVGSDALQLGGHYISIIVLRHRLKWIIHPHTQSLRKGDNCLTYIPVK